jgi:hypothetical protein
LTRTLTASISNNAKLTAIGQRRIKKLVAELEAKGLMTDFGRAKIDGAKQNGSCDAPNTTARII